MEIATLVSVLDQPHLAADYLHGWRLRDVPRGQRILLELAEAGLTLDLLAGVCSQLAEHLPQTPDPDGALSAFRRYLFAVRSPLSLAALLERDPLAMPMLLAALSLGPRWAELLCDDAEAFDLLRQTEGSAVDLAMLRSELLAEVEAFSDDRLIAAALARLRRRHLLRIAYGELVHGHRLESMLEQLSQLGEALVEAALAAALRKVQGVKGMPSGMNLRQVRASVIALGPLGAEQVNFSLPLGLLFVYQATLKDPATLRFIHEQFDRGAKLVMRLLTEAWGNEVPGAVRLISLPDCPTAAAAHSEDDVVIGFDSYGRTWHRQEMLHARAVAGDRRLGEEVLSRLQSWLFRRYMNRADETGIKALKRRILIRAILHQDDWRNTRLARGGIDDIEATVEFLQLLAGGDQPAVRRRGTLAALIGLEEAGTITADERTALKQSYLFFRRLEHRLQILLGSPVMELPLDESSVERIARSLGHVTNATTFIAELRNRLDVTWQTLDKLLVSAFPEEPPAAREVDLLLDPAPPPEEVRAALSPFGFDEPQRALTILNDLATEQVLFLSTRRCRHLLASILPQLLCAIGATPNPDRTLDNLAQVSNSLGGKGVLWDLFRFNPPSLELYVKLCAASPYLSNILTTNPGMIDELIDSLQLDKLPTIGELRATLTELCRGAADTLPALHDFNNAAHLRIGVRDILGKEDIDRTQEALADVAETCLAHVADLEYNRLVEKYGLPTIGSGSAEGKPCRLVIVGLGKLGGREPNYHSHLDVLFLYEAEGTTRPAEHWRRVERTANNHFFTQLAQRVIKQLSQLTPKGRLYAIDTPLRPIGVGGALAISVADFSQHFASGAAPLWQWQALCQARPVFGEAMARENAARIIRQLIADRPSREADRNEIRLARLQLQKGAEPSNLKRGPGGTLDVEFIVQMLQLRYAATKSEVLTSNTQDSLGALARAGALPSDVAEQLGDSYRFIRRVESGLHLLETSPRHALPTDEQELRRLALLLGHSNPDRLCEQCFEAMAKNRVTFDLLTGEC
jgi:glutamate-ammonia-ligase adenylyltransferase